MSKCICDYEIKDPPYEGWEECPNCERILGSLEHERKQILYVEGLETKLEAVEEKCKDLDFEAQGLLVDGKVDRASAFHYAIDKIREAIK